MSTGKYRRRLLKSSSKEHSIYIEWPNSLRTLSWLPGRCRCPCRRSHCGMGIPSTAILGLSRRHITVRYQETAHQFFETSAFIPFRKRIFLVAFQYCRKIHHQSQSFFVLLKYSLILPYEREHRGHKFKIHSSGCYSAHASARGTSK